MKQISLKKKEIKKIRPIKNTWYCCLTNYIPDPIRKSVGGFNDKVVINCVWERKVAKQNKKYKTK